MLGERLRELRLRHGLTLRELADPVAYARRVAVAVKPGASTETAEPGDEGMPGEPDAPEAAGS